MRIKTSVISLLTAISIMTGALFAQGVNISKSESPQSSTQSKVLYDFNEAPAVPTECTSTNEGMVTLSMNTDAVNAMSGNSIKIESKGTWDWNNGVKITKSVGDFSGEGVSFGLKTDQVIALEISLKKSGGQDWDKYVHQVYNLQPGEFGEVKLDYKEFGYSYNGGTKLTDYSAVEQYNILEIDVYNVGNASNVFVDSVNVKAGVSKMICDFDAGLQSPSNIKSDNGVNLKILGGKLNASNLPNSDWKLSVEESGYLPFGGMASGIEIVADVDKYAVINLKLVDEASTEWLVGAQAINGGKLSFNIADAKKLWWDNGGVAITAKELKNCHKLVLDISKGGEAPTTVSIDEIVILNPELEPEIVNVTGVSLTETSKTLNEGEKATLVAEISPSNADNKAVVWTSDRISVADVSNTGEITAISEGTANITVKTVDGAFTASCCVKVNPITPKKILYDFNILDEVPSTIKKNGNISLAVTDNNLIVTNLGKNNYDGVEITPNATSAFYGDGIIIRAIGSTEYTRLFIKIKNKNSQWDDFRFVADLVAGENILKIPFADFEYYMYGSDKNGTPPTKEEILTFDYLGIEMYTNTENVELKLNQISVYNPSEVEQIPVESVSLDCLTKQILVGQSSKLTATILPNNAANKDVKFKSDNSNIVTVDENGNITAKAEGITKITVTTQDGGKTAECRITVIDVDPNHDAKSIWHGGGYYQYSEQAFSVSAEKIEDDNRFNSSLNIKIKDTEKYLKGEQVHVYATDMESIVISDISKAIYSELGVVRFWVKVPKENSKFGLSLMSHHNGSYVTTDIMEINLEQCDGWQKVTIPLKDFKYPSNFAMEKMERLIISNIPSTSTSKDYILKNEDTIKLARMEILSNTPKNDPSDPKYDNVESVSLDITRSTLSVGDRIKLTASITPKTSDQGTTWSISDADIAIVNGLGEIMAKKSGNAIVTVTTDNGKKIAKCSITVKDIDFDAPSKLLYDADYTKGVWSNNWNSGDKNKLYVAMSSSFMEDNDPELYKFKRYGDYKITNNTKFWENPEQCGIMYWGSMFSKTHPSFDRANLKPFIGTATVRLYIKAPREGVRFSVGVQDTTYRTGYIEVATKQVGEWCEYQIPLKDFYNANKDMDLEQIRHFIFRTAVNSQKDDADTPKENEIFSVAGIQIWSKEAVEPKKVIVDKTRTFIDETNDNFKLIDKNENIPTSASLRVVELNDLGLKNDLKNQYDMDNNFQAIDLYVINNGKKIRSTYDNVELWYKLPNELLKRTVVPYLISPDGTIKKLDYSRNGDNLVTSLSEFGRIIFSYGKINGINSSAETGDNTRIILLALIAIINLGAVCTYYALRTKKTN